MSTRRTRGSAPPPMRSGSARRAVGALLGALPGFERGRGRAEHHRHAFEAAAVDRQVARRVARALLLLERRVVLFVDDDQARAAASTQTPPAACRAPGRPGRGARPASGVRRCAGVRPLCSDTRRWPAKRCGEARLELRREVDLGHQHQHLPAGRERARRGLQVDLGLAAAGDAVQQHGWPARRRGQRRDRGRLVGVSARRARPSAAAGARRGFAGARARRASCAASSLRNSGGSTASASSPRPRW